jgi:formate dehydrogenase subunit gamma
MVETYQALLWFDQLWWAVLLMPFLGLLAAAASRRDEPRIDGERVLRHDKPARLAHWTHALGTTMLLVSGIFLGTRFSPSLSSGNAETEVWLNIHFLFVLFFLFGSFYYLGNTLISRWRFKEHLPRRNAISSTLNHYGSLLGIKRCKYPEEEKYFESERLAYVMAVVVCFLLIVSGFLKILGHFVDMPEAFMGAVTWCHDLSAALMVLFFVAHIMMGTLLPWAWKAVPSMFTGYMKKEDAKHEYPAWVASLEKQQAEMAEDADKGGAQAEASTSSSATDKTTSKEELA